MDELLFSGKPKGANWGVGIILVNDGKILLGLRTDNKLWGSPGGGVDDGETPLDAIVRETKEETNLDIKSTDVYFVSKTYSLNEGVIWTSFIFVADKFTGEAKPQLTECSELKWVPVADIYEYSLFTPTRESLAEVFRWVPDIIFRSISSLKDPNGYQMDQMAELVPTFEGVMDISFSVTKYADVYKMTSIEQLVGVKNPGKNGGLGGIGSDGNWKYTKPGGKGVNVALPQNRNRENEQSQYLAELRKVRESYVEHFTKKDSFEKKYQVKDGNFIFPDYTVAKQEGLCTDKKSYMRVFKEQYVHYALTKGGI